MAVEFWLWDGEKFAFFLPFPENQVRCLTVLGIHFPCQLVCYFSDRALFCYPVIMEFLCFFDRKCELLINDETILIDLLKNMLTYW